MPKLIHSASPRYTIMAGELPSPSENVKMGMLGRRTHESKSDSPEPVVQIGLAERWILSPTFQLCLLASLGIVYSLTLIVAAVHFCRGVWATPALVPVLLSFAYSLSLLGKPGPAHILISLMLAEFLLASAAVVVYSLVKGIDPR